MKLKCVNAIRTVSSSWENGAIFKGLCLLGETQEVKVTNVAPGMRRDEIWTDHNLVKYEYIWFIFFVQREHVKIGPNPSGLGGVIENEHMRKG